MVVLAGMTVAPIAMAQQADAQMKQAVEAISAKWTESANRGDADASFFVPDAVHIDVYGEHNMSQGADVAKTAKRMGVSIATKVDDVKPLASGQLMLVTGTFDVSYTNNPTTKTAHGNWLRLLQKGRFGSEDCRSIPDARGATRGRHRQFDRAHKVRNASAGRASKAKR